MPGFTTNSNKGRRECGAVAALDLRLLKSALPKIALLKCTALKIAALKAAPRRLHGVVT
jgi:hypothetical protein